jgi:hypothetical protein
LPARDRDSASASPSPVPSLQTARSSCSTRRQAPSTASPRPLSRKPSETSCAAALQSWCPTASPPWQPSTASSCLPAAGSWRMARTQSSCRKAARTQSSGSARPAASSRRSESVPVFQLSRGRMRPCVLSPRISPDETAAHARGALLPRQRPERRRTSASRLTRLVGSPQSSSTGGRSALKRKPMPCP